MNKFKNTKSYLDYLMNSKIDFSVSHAAKSYIDNGKKHDVHNITFVSEEGEKNFRRVTSIPI